MQLHFTVKVLLKILNEAAQHSVPYPLDWDRFPYNRFALLTYSATHTGFVLVKQSRRALQQRPTFVCISSNNFRLTIYALKQHRHQIHRFKEYRRMMVLLTLIQGPKSCSVIPSVLMLSSTTQPFSYTQSFSTQTHLPRVEASSK